MALLPALLNELIDDLSSLNRPTRYHLGDLFDQHFGMGLSDLGNATRLTPHHLPALRAGYLRPWRNHLPPESGISSFKADDHQFIVQLDVSHFKPDELKVHVDDHSYVVVEGKHEERMDEHGLISRQFVRRYKLPELVNLDSLSSTVSTDGVLTVAASKKVATAVPGREIKIVPTNHPALQPQLSTAEKKTELKGEAKIDEERAETPSETDESK